VKGKFSPITLLSVDLELGEPIRVGRLAFFERQIVFEFDENFPADTLNISPFMLRPSPGSTLIKGPDRLFDGLHGVFNDSLPDGWGRLLIDRKLREVGIRQSQLTPLDRLAWIGSRGMGALTYKPEHPALADGDGQKFTDLDAIADAARVVLEDSPEAVFDQLLEVGGSPGGARPKALIDVSVDGATVIHGESDLPDGYDHWLVKFGAREDVPEIGRIEQAYADMAAEAGVTMPETRVFPSKSGPGYFGIKRFDRNGCRRWHMHTICGLLHADFRLPSIGYEELLKATMALTRQQPDLEQMFTRMVFNVYAHNRDDHTKNHSFLMDASGEWRLSPAYDVVFSDGPGGEHSLDIGGEGTAPGEADIQKVGKSVGLSKAFIADCIDKVRTSVDQWATFADRHGVPRKLTSEIASVLGVAGAKEVVPVGWTSSRPC